MKHKNNPAGNTSTTFSVEWIPYALILAVLIGAWITAAVMPDATPGKPAGISEALPDQIGAWKGENLFFCQNESCLRSFTEQTLGTNRVCPRCGGTIERTWSLAERRLLPKDTVLLKKVYHHPNGQSLTVSVVISGTERVSIHRPQMCLVGQGYDIIHEQNCRITIPGKAPLWGRDRVYFRGPIKALAGAVVRTAEARRASTHLPLVLTVETSDPREFLKIKERTPLARKQPDPICG